MFRPLLFPFEVRAYIVPKIGTTIIEPQLLLAKRFDLAHIFRAQREVALEVAPDMPCTGGLGNH